MRKDKRSSTNLIFYFFSSLIFALTLETRVTAEKFLWWPLAGNLFAVAGTLSEEIRWSTVGKTAALKFVTFSEEFSGGGAENSLTVWEEQPHDFCSRQPLMKQCQIAVKGGLVWGFNQHIANTAKL